MTQSYKNHSRIDIGFHRILSLLVIAGLIGSIVNLFESVHNDNLYSASLLTLLFLIAAIMYAYVRIFPLRAQDRVIRAEENMRHYILTGTTLPPRLRIKQVIALRFAPDEEFPELTKRAVAENMTSREIKKAIQNWKADHYRV